MTDAHHTGRLEAELAWLARYPLVVIDEVGYIPLALHPPFADPTKQQGAQDVGIAAPVRLVGGRPLPRAARSCCAWSNASWGARVSCTGSSDHTQASLLFQRSLVVWPGWMSWTSMGASSLRCLAHRTLGGRCRPSKASIPVACQAREVTCGGGCGIVLRLGPVPAAFARRRLRGPTRHRPRREACTCRWTRSSPP